MGCYSLTVIFISLLAYMVFQVIGTTENDAQHLRQIQKPLFRKLLHLVTSPQEPKGRPFMKLISKPRPRDKVAIVGAGLAGLHMAWLLKKQGYNNVVVLEKENRTGGKIMSEKHRGVFHELGACYLSSDYKENVIALARELGIADDIFPQPSKLRTVWLDSIPQPLTIKQFTILEVYKLTGSKNPADAIMNFLNATIRYTAIHREMFGKYKLGLMNRPCQTILQQLKQPYLSFLRQHDLLALVPVLTFAQTLQGYGPIDSVPALYGVLWNTPEFLLSVIGGVVAGQTSQLMFRHGFIQVTDKLAELADDVRLNVQIKEIQRSNCGIKILYQNHKTESFDYLIWAADARDALGVINNATPEEKKFRSLKNAWFTTTLFDSIEKCKTPLPVQVWVDSILQKQQHSVWSRRISEYALYGGNCTTPPGVKTPLSSVAYQFGSKMSSSWKIHQKFLNHFTCRVGAEDIHIVKRKTWNYFPRFSVNATANGVLWDVADRQGAHNTWFIGSSVFFEATNHVINYNKLMINRMLI